MRRAPRTAPLLILSLLAGFACSARSPDLAPGRPATVAPAGDEELERRALLLLLADRKLFEPDALGLMLDGSPVEREDLAVALGRIGDSRGRSLLQGLLVDKEPPVRRAAAFALGVLGAPEAIAALRVAAVDDDPETGALAVEALGKLAAPLADVRRILGALGSGEGDRRLAPYLFRFKDPALVEAAVSLLGSSEPEVRSGAAYALGREARPEGLRALRGLVVDDDPIVRAWAARGLGTVGGAEDLALLLALAGDGEASPRIQAYTAAGRIRQRVDALPADAWRLELVRALDDPLPGVRAAALEAAGRFLPGRVLEAALTDRFRAGPPRERELALGALAHGAPDLAKSLLAQAVGASAPELRARAAEVAGQVGALSELEALSADSTPAVRRAALEAALALAVEPPTGLLKRGLADPDPTVRATALDHLTSHPVLDLDELVEAVRAAQADRELDARLAAVRAVAARAESAPAERVTAAAILEAIARDREYLVRREAGDGLAALGYERPAATPIDTGRSAAAYREALLQAESRPLVDLETDRGAIRIRLECPEAPLTCLSFWKLADQGYFDGIAWHRVVPDFVVQGGDPRGDGWGGPGYTMRDEINRLRYTRGAVGMALSGPDTGGSQFFVTLSRQPHLDGGYTVFGTVVDGIDRLDRIEQGDRILSARRVD